MPTCSPFFALQEFTDFLAKPTYGAPKRAEEQY